MVSYKSNRLAGKSIEVNPRQDGSEYSIGIDTIHGQRLGHIVDALATPDRHRAGCSLIAWILLGLAATACVL